MGVFTPTGAFTSCDITSGTINNTRDGSTSTYAQFYMPQSCGIVWYWPTPQNLTKFEMYATGYASGKSNIYKVEKLTAPFNPGDPYANRETIHTIITNLNDYSWTDILKGYAATQCYGIFIWVQHVSYSWPNLRIFEVRATSATYPWHAGETSHNFGDIIVNECSEVYYINIYNDSDVELTLTQRCQSGPCDPFNPPRIFWSTGGMVIPPHSSRTFGVQFCPVAATTYACVFRITCQTEGGTPPYIDLSYTGRGVVPQPPYPDITSFTANPTYVNHPTAAGTDITLTAIGKNIGGSQGTFIMTIFNQYQGNPLNCGYVVLNPGQSHTCIKVQKAKKPTGPPYDYAEFQAEFDTEEDYDLATVQVQFRYTTGGIDIPGSTFYSSFIKGEQGALIAEIKLMNTGAASGLVYTKYFYKPQGGVWTDLTGIFEQTIAAGANAIASHHGNIPNIEGNVQFGVKVWGQDEAEPALLSLVWS